MKKRFQECSKIVQIWRLKDRLFIPFRVLKLWIKSNPFKCSIKLCYLVLRGESDINIEYYYTFDEVKESLKKRHRS